MKGVLKRLTALGIIGGTLLGVTAAQPQAAWALSDEEIIEKLSSVPVFMIVDEEGRSLTANVETAESGQSSAPIVFISGNAAQAFLDQEADATLAEEGQVAILSLGDLYEEAGVQSDQSLVYIPTSAALEAANSIANGAAINGVPLFAAVNLENGQYLITSEQTLPVYFSFADLQRNIAPLVEENPELQDVIGVEVLTLEGLIRGMESDNPELDRLLELVLLIPDSASVQYLRDLSGGNPTAQ